MSSAFRAMNPMPETFDLLELIQPGGFLSLPAEHREFRSDLRPDHSSSRNFSIPAGSGHHRSRRRPRGSAETDLSLRFRRWPSWLPAGMAQLRLGARIIAAELEATGFNLELCSGRGSSLSRIDARGAMPGGRSCRSRPPGAAFVEELAKRGIMTCAKHFPGLGAAHGGSAFFSAAHRSHETAASTGRRSSVREAVRPDGHGHDRPRALSRSGRRETDSGFSVVRASSTVFFERNWATKD